MEEMQNGKKKKNGRLQTIYSIKNRETEDRLKA